MLPKIYCVKCQSYTDNFGKPVYHKTSKGHKYLIIKCKTCKNKKSQFV